MTSMRLLVLDRWLGEWKVRSCIEKNEGERRSSDNPNPRGGSVFWLTFSGPAFQH